MYGRDCLFTTPKRFEKYQAQIEDCVKGSFEVYGDTQSDNKIFNADVKWARKLNLGYHPSITINDFTYRGAITYKDLT